MSKRLCAFVAVLICLSTPAWAQHRAEAGIFFGYSFQDGVSGTAFLAPDGHTYNRIDPKDSFKWGLTFGVNVNENVQVGFMFTQAPTKLQLGGSQTRDVGEWNITTYHGYFEYDMGEHDAKIRPYFMGGLGATNFGSVDYTVVNPLITGQTSGTINSLTKFSTTWGVGVKAYLKPNVGVRLGFGWTPTYIKSDPGGWWCDPYWGCYLTGNAQYSNAVDLTGGITFRF